MSKENWKITRVFFWAVGWALIGALVVTYFKRG
jgi:hypothetical protein